MGARVARFGDSRDESEEPHDREQTHITSHHASRAITKRASLSRAHCLIRWSH